MWTALRLAGAVREKYAIRGVATEDEIDLALAGEGLVVWERAPLRGRVRGLHYEGVVALGAHLGRGERCAVKGHELAHFLLHDRNALYLAVPSQKVLGSRHESEATLFAGGLLIGVPKDDLAFDRRLHDAFDQGIPASFLFTYMNGLLKLYGGNIPCGRDRRSA